MTRRRKRFGKDEEKLEILLEQTLEAAKKKKVLKEQDVKRVVVDTTVQEKAVAFPNDSRLYFKGTRALVKAAMKEGVNFRQSYVRVTKKLLLKQSRYSHAKQMKRARSAQRQLRTILGRVIRDVERKLQMENQSDRIKN